MLSKLSSLCGALRRPIDGTSYKSEADRMPYWFRGSAALSTVYQRISLMGINKDQVEGRVKEAAGKVQEATGKAMGSGTQQAKGMARKVTGGAQAAYGDVKEDVKEIAKDGQHKHG